MKNKLILLGIIFSLVTGMASAQLGSDPVLQEYSEPDITVDQEANTVTGTFYLENTGGSFANIGDDTWIIEIQPERQTAFSFLSATGLSRPDTCDDSKPKNVHREMVFQNGERKAISITSPLNGEGSLQPGEYNLKVLTVTGCATGDTAESNVQAVDPYRWGTDAGSFTVEKDTTDTDGSDSDDTTTDSVWIAYSNSQNCVQVAESNVPNNLESYSSQSQCVENTDAKGLPLLPLGITGVLVLGTGLYFTTRYDILG